MTATLKAELLLDTDAAEKKSQSFSSAIRDKLGAAANAVRASVDGWGKSLSGVGSKIVVAAQAFRLMDSASAAVKGALEGISSVFDTIQAKTDTLGRAKYFGVTTEQVKLLRAGLSDVKTELEATALATALVAGGFNKIQIGKFADAINVISGLTGTTKQSVEDMLRAGELSNEALRVIGRTRQEADAVVAQAAIAAGGRELTAMEKTRALLNAFGSDIAKVKGQMGDIGQSNPFKVLQKELQGLWDEMSTSLKPALTEVVALVSKNKKVLVDFFAGAMSVAADFAGLVVKALGKMQEFFTFVGGAARSFSQMFSSSQRKEIEQQGRWLDEQLAKEKAKRGIAANEMIATAKTAEKAVATVREKVGNRAAQARLAQARLEAKQETLGRIAEARAMVRNFEMLAMEAAGALGGPVSGALSAFKDSFEKFKVLGAAYGNTLTRLGNTSEEELKRLRSAGKITESQLKAVQLFQTYLRAGELDLREYLGTERQVNAQLLAQRSILAANNAIAAAQVEKLNQEKDVRAAITAITRTISLLEGKDDIVSQRKLGILKATLAQYTAIQSQRSQILTLALQTAQIDKALERTKFSTEFVRQAKDLADATKQVRFELESLSAKDDPVLASRLEAAQQQFRVELSIQDLLRKQQDAMTTIRDLRQKRGLAGQSEENRALFSEQIQSLQLQTAELKFQAKLQTRIRETSAQIFAINAAIATEKQRVERERALQDIEVQRLQLVQQIAAANNRLRGEDAAALQIGQAKVALDRKIADNQQRILEIEMKRRALAASPDAVAALNKEAMALAEQNKQLQRQISLQDELLARTKYMFTVGGSMLAQLQAQAVDAAQKIGQAAASASMGLINAFGGALSGLFEQLVQADKDLAKNFGKAVLSALGDMAIAFANTFAAVGVGRIALGDVAGGAGLIAASAALYIVAGTLKGLGAAITATSQTPTSSGSSPERSTLPGQQVERQKEQRTTYVLISGFLGSEQEQYRKFQQFVRKNSRAVGG